MNTQRVQNVVIGAGPSGLACAVRLALAGQSVVLLESHTIVGGLNSYYQKKYFDADSQTYKTIKLDVGLHAITNFTHSSNRQLPLAKLARQLRLDPREWQLKEQNFSIIQMKDQKIFFNNELTFFTAELLRVFPDQEANLFAFYKFIDAFDEFDPHRLPFESAQHRLSQFFNNAECCNFLLFPVLTYGSAWELDMDFSLFVCLFKSMFQQGMCRPLGGIRQWWQPMMAQLDSLKVEVALGEKVLNFVLAEDSLNQKVNRVKTSKGREIFCDRVFSSIGAQETEQVLTGKKLAPHYLSNSINAESSNADKCMTFMEGIFIFEDLEDKLSSPPTTEHSHDDHHKLPTLLFWSKTQEIPYRVPQDLWGEDFAVICIPSQYRDHAELPEVKGMVRITLAAHPWKWHELSAKDYQAAKAAAQTVMIRILGELIPRLRHKKIKFVDVFTPKTITKYTGHWQGALYGGTQKFLDGKTMIENLFLIGTDQGLPGIVGAMLSGIQMANLYAIMGTK